VVAIEAGIGNVTCAGLTAPAGIETKQRKQLCGHATPPEVQAFAEKLAEQ
jgi:hypothetical protein